MRFLKKNEGFTLVELLVVITVGSLVSFAATSILLFAMRFYRVNLDTVEHQGILRIMLTMVENMSSEGEYTFDLDNNAIEKDTDAIIRYNPSTKQVTTGNGAVLMEKVDGFDIKKPSVLELYDEAAENLYTFTIDMDNQTFDSTVYSRTQSVKIEDVNYPFSVFPLYHHDEWEADDPDLDYEAGRELMVNLAASQIGSLGTIMNYISQVGKIQRDYNLWYLYPNPDNNGQYITQYPEGWTKDTAWCSVFASWVVEQAKSITDENNNTVYYLDSVPKEANVNHLWMRIYLQSESMESFHFYEKTPNYVPKPGDLVFFTSVLESLQGENLLPLENLNLYTKQYLQEAINIEKCAKYINRNSAGIYKNLVPDDEVLGDKKPLEEADMIHSYEEYSVLVHFLGGSGDGLDHVGIVVEVKDGYVYTIEGNVKVNGVPTVVLRRHPLENPNPPAILDDPDFTHIFGYATLNWNEAYK